MAKKLYLPIAFAILIVVITGWIITGMSSFTFRQNGPAFIDLSTSDTAKESGGSTT